MAAYAVAASAGTPDDRVVVRVAVGTATALSGAFAFGAWLRREEGVLVHPRGPIATREVKAEDVKWWGLALIAVGIALAATATWLAALATAVVASLTVSYYFLRRHYFMFRNIFATLTVVLPGLAGLTATGVKEYNFIFPLTFAGAVRLAASFLEDVEMAHADAIVGVRTVAQSNHRRPAALTLVCLLLAAAVITAAAFSHLYDARRLGIISGAAGLMFTYGALNFRAGARDTPLAASTARMFKFLIFVSLGVWTLG